MNEEEMEIDKLIRALQFICDFYEDSLGDWSRDALCVAKDTLASQQSRIADLEKQLSESQRREMAAESCLTDLGAIDDDSLYDDDISSIAWKVLTKWRGPQDEKGEKE